MGILLPREVRIQGRLLEILKEEWKGGDGAGFAGKRKGCRCQEVFLSISATSSGVPVLTSIRATANDRDDDSV